MKKTFTVSTSEPCEYSTIENYVNAEKYLGVLQELDNWLRGKIKYEDREELQEARTQLWELLKEEGIDIHE